MNNKHNKQKSKLIKFLYIIFNEYLPEKYNEQIEIQDILISRGFENIKVFLVDDDKKLIKHLNSNTTLFASKLFSNLSLKRMPKLLFLYDGKYGEIERTLRILEDIKNDS